MTSSWNTEIPKGSWRKLNRIQKRVVMTFIYCWKITVPNFEQFLNPHSLYLSCSTRAPWWHADSLRIIDALSCSSVHSIANAWGVCVGSKGQCCKLWNKVSLYVTTRISKFHGLTLLRFSTHLWQYSARTSFLELMFEAQLYNCPL